MGSVAVVMLPKPDPFRDPRSYAACVFRGHELTPKHCRLSSGIAALDAIIDGGIVRGRISEIVGPVGSGRTTLAARFVSAATRAGEVVAWLEGARGFAPGDIAAASVDLARVLWASVDDHRRLAMDFSGRFRRYRYPQVFKAAEMVLRAGGFGLVVIDAAVGAPLPPSMALRLAREAERSGAAVMVVAPHRICGTFAALSLKLARNEASFHRLAPSSPALFDGLVIRVSTIRNKLGRTGASAIICASLDPAAAPSAHRIEPAYPALRASNA
jgi:hypothetical protein